MGAGTGRDAVIEVQGLHLERQGSLILQDVDLAVPRGASTAIVGPSGSGKTALLRCLNGLERPSCGRVLLDGLDIERIDPVELRRRVGMIFQVPAMLEGSVRDNLLYGLEHAADEELAGAMSSADLDPGFLQRSSAALSVGQAQRVCIARALIRRPEVLLMDEPTSALDRDAAARIEDLVHRLVSDKGLTVLFVTHDLAQAKRVAGGAALLVNRTLREAGSPDELERMWEEFA